MWYPQVSVHGKPVDLDSSSFGISGLKLMGAEHEIDSGKLKITEDIMTDLAYTKISWVREQDIILLGKKVRISVYIIFLWIEKDQNINSMVALCLFYFLVIIVSIPQFKHKYTLQITLPVYLNNTRTTLVETLDFPTNEDQFYERGVAILCTPLS